LATGLTEPNQWRTPQFFAIYGHCD